MRVMIKHFYDQGAIRYQLSGPIGIITIDRPSQRNALSRQMWQALYEFATHLPEKTKVLIVRGAGQNFTAGSDIKEFATLGVDDANKAFITMEKAIRAIENLSIPTIASVNGPAYGAGFILTLSCDMRIGSEYARFGMPVGKLGITLQPEFIRRMVQLLGPSRTKDMVYTARSYSAEEAFALGLLNYVVPDSQLDERTFKLARRILEQSQASMFAVKESVRKVLDGHLNGTDNWVDQRDFFEGVRAFKEKRAASFARPRVR